MDTQTITLDEALNMQSTEGKPVKTFVGFNSGRRTFTMVMSLFELFQFSDVANDRLPENLQSQRKLDIKHATEIAKYILKALLSAAENKKRKQGDPISEKFVEIKKNMGSQPYLSIPPIVACLRNCEPNGTNLAVVPLQSISDKETAAYKIFLNHGDVLWIVDGQHRRKAIEIVFEFINYVTTYNKYPARGSLYNSPIKDELSVPEINVWNACKEISKYCTVTVEVHLGLNIDEERQLFHDLNNLAKKVEKSLALKFDMSNPVNSYISQVLIDDVFSENSFTVFDKDETDWLEELPGITRKQLVAINAVLLLNKTNINGATPTDVSDIKKEKGVDFWNAILTIPGINEAISKTKTVAAQPVVLKALAKLYYDIFFGKNKELNTIENQEKLEKAIHSFDFSHGNPAWQYYFMTDDEKNNSNLDGLSNYLPSDDQGYNRDLGTYDPNSSTFRFGAKHNDIYPIIGDIIRWHASLPSRRKHTSLAVN